MKNLSLYIHIPFCKCICLYCNFLTFANKKPDQINSYIKRLKYEITQKAAIFGEYKIKTVYFGGGTPSQIDSKHIKDILNTIRTSFAVNKKAELSLESNPESITGEKLDSYVASGINRITLGIQSLNKKTLFRIARPHDEQKIYSALNLIRKTKITNFGADIIMGLPYQTFKSFKKEMTIILSYGIPHLSLYFLSYDTKKIDLFIKDCPSEEDQIKMYNYACKTLKKNGHIHYEVSSFAKPGFECKHNKRYWNQKEYLGFGLGAHSYINGKTVENITEFNEYLSNPLAVKEEIVIDRELHMLEHIMLRLRTNRGIDLTKYKKKYNNEKELLKNAAPYLKSKHLIIENNQLKASEKGFLILDRITHDLL